MTLVVLYGRPECCLCDDAREIIERARARHAFVLQELDIDEDPKLMREYLERIPVVTINGEEAFALSVSESELERRLEAAAEPSVE